MVYMLTVLLQIASAGVWFTDLNLRHLVAESVTKGQYSGGVWTEQHFLKRSLLLEYRSNSSQIGSFWSVQSNWIG